MASVIRGSDNFDSAIKKGLGDGQTWQNVLSSRANNVTYTNTTGRPIAVTASNGDGNGTGANSYVDGVLLVRNVIYGTGGSLAFFIVPAGSTYKIIFDALNPTNWKELR